MYKYIYIYINIYICILRYIHICIARSFGDDMGSSLCENDGND